MKKLSVRDMDLSGKKVLCRVDFNVPLSKEGKITDDNRIVAALPTIKLILDNGGRLILMSHLGRPKGKPEAAYSLKPAKDRLQELLGKPVAWASDCVGAEAEQVAASLKDGEVALLENLRFHKEEEGNSPEFSQALAKLADLYINDAFGTAHRAHASTEGVTHHFKQNGAGLLMEKEVEYLSSVIENPATPFVAILGGAKVSDKMAVLQNLAGKVDKLIVGGAMAYTFLKAQGVPVGSSLVENDRIEDARKMMADIQKTKTSLLLPEDHVVASKPDAADIEVSGPGIPEGKMGLDIGPQTVAAFQKALQDARTVVWNGPLGMFENNAFAKGTEAVAQTLAGINATVVVGGGDSAAALAKLNLCDKVSHVSTGGGASLEMLEGKILPGVAALTDAPGGK